MNMENRFIGIDDASRLLNLSKSTIYKRTMSNDIPHYKPGGKLLFLQEELIAYVRNYKSDNKTIEKVEDDSFLDLCLVA